VVAPFRYAGIVWALLLDLAIWAHIPDAPAMVGIAAVTGAGIYTFYRERVLRRVAARKIEEMAR
jgi:drug/metabolite transporter (DMT)-like permease